MKPSDLTLIEGTVTALNTIAAMAYMAIAWAIYTRKRYLLWNKHIYPTMMWGSVVFSGSLFWLLTTEYFLGIKTEYAFLATTFFMGALAIGYGIVAEAVRLAYKFDAMADKDKEILSLKNKNTALTDLIEIMKKNKVLIFLLGLLFLVNCGGLKKEISRLSEESKTKTEAYQKEITQRDAKIKEVEQRETATKTELQQKQTEISTLKKEKESIQEQLEELKEEDIIIDNANGTVKITDHNGNVYEIPSTQGTTIAKSSVSKLTTQLNSVKESFAQATERVKFLTQSIFTKDKTIKEKESEITQSNEVIKEQNEYIKKQKEQLEKEVTKSGISPFIWIAIGMGLMVVIILVWKAYATGNPIFKIFKK